MENGLAEMHAQWPVQGLVTRSGGLAEAVTPRMKILRSLPNKALPTSASKGLTSPIMCEG